MIRRPAVSPIRKAPGVHSGPGGGRPYFGRYSRTVLGGRFELLGFACDGEGRQGVSPRGAPFEKRVR